MNKLFYALGVFLLITACKKDYDEIDQEKISTYVKSKGLTPLTTESGVHYIIEKEGKGDFLKIDDEIAVKYRGYFLNDKEFDKSDSAIFIISNVINGWQDGLAKFKEGSKGKMFIPSDLAYGKSGVSQGGIEFIPSRAVLGFDVEILKKNPIGEKNRNEIKKFIAEKGWKADSLPSGLYFVIDEPGTGNSKPTTSSVVTVKYKGYTLDGKIFDQSTGNGLTIGLDRVIDGWRLGIPLFKKGGKGKLLIPSRLGYYSTGSGAIPSYAPIVFEVELVDF